MSRRIGVIAASLMALGLAGSAAAAIPDRVPAPKAPAVAAQAQRQKKVKPRRKRSMVSTGSPFPRVHPLPAIRKHVRVRSVARLLQRLKGEHRRRQRGGVLRQLQVILGTAG